MRKIFRAARATVGAISCIHINRHTHLPSKMAGRAGLVVMKAATSYRFSLSKHNILECVQRERKGMKESMSNK